MIERAGGADRAGAVLGSGPARLRSRAHRGRAGRPCGSDPAGGSAGKADRHGAALCGRVDPACADEPSRSSPGALSRSEARSARCAERYGQPMPRRSSASVKRLTLVACILGSGIVLLDGTVVNVALPTIQRALGGGLAAQQWVVNGYLLTLGSLILVGGSLGDLYGERRVFAIGVAGFGVASVAVCGLADDRRARRGARAAGDRGRAARAELAGGDRQHVPGVRARRRRSAAGRRGARSRACSGRWRAASCWRSPRGAGSS